MHEAIDELQHTRGGGGLEMKRSQVDRAKHEARQRAWSRLDRERVVEPPGAQGRIPNFVGAEAAASRLASLEQWRASRVVKANPDKPQLPVRARALADGKLVYMAVPRMADERPFYRLDPATLTVPADQAASSDVASRLARKVGVDAFEPVDLVVCGSVAVDRNGTRVGKGAGYSDIEVALLIEAGLISERTVIVTTVHPLQVVDEDLPETEHDFSVDVIVTTDEVIDCGPPRRPRGFVWEHLTQDTIAAIPVLAARRAPS